MSFWAYMLHCRGGAFYVGHTDTLDRRIGDHKSGLVPGFTADHLPVELVWSQDFVTRDEAKACEGQIKGWSRAKKLALIRGDWERISALAKGKNGPSTSSGKTGKGEGNPLGSESKDLSKLDFPKPAHPKPFFPKPVYPELVEGLSFSLLPHPETPPSKVRAVSARIWMTDTTDLLIEFTVEGSETLRLPERAKPTRRDGLWQSTCFEMFLMRDDGRYFEFNLSPSSEWAIYAFDSYRNGMSPLEVDIPPQIEITESVSAFSLEADVDLGQIPLENLALALCAVIEETGGHKSYWALAHPPGKPDFHHAACFTATLPAPQTP